MPKKATITKDMVINATFDLIRKSGAEKMNVRNIAKELDCSTQPIMYHFAKIEDLRIAMYHKIDWFHTNYLMNIDNKENSSVKIAMNYIQFAITEPHLFRFLFQSGYAVENNLLEMVDSDALVPVISAMQESTGLNTEQVKKVFITTALFTHGYASIIVNNSLEYDEKTLRAHIERAYRGAVLAVKEESKC